MDRKMEFQPDEESWDSYTERLNCLFTATGITEDEKKVSTLIYQNGPALYTLLKELSFPQNPTQMSYNEVMDILRRHYVGAKSVFCERKIFYTASMEPCETAADWLHRLRSLAANCDFGKFREEILVDKFVTGFHQANVLQRLYEHDGDLSLQQALEIAQCNENHLSADGQSSLSLDKSHNELQTYQRSIQDEPEVEIETASDFVHVQLNITESDQQECKYQKHQPNIQRAQKPRSWQTPLHKVLNHFQTLHWQQQRLVQEQQRKLQQQQQRVLQEQQRKLQQQQQQQERLLKEQQRKLQLTQQQQEQQKRLLQDHQQKLKQQKLQQQQQEHQKQQQQHQKQQQQQQQHQKQQQVQSNVPTCHKCSKKGHSANACTQKTLVKKASGTASQKPVKPKPTTSVKRK